ncbi:DNA repair protein RecO [Bernardetia sp.]|uniref:DNA repair protein RecO n=1 Tax=Bernardetia sp. TaxID=1937974 RepID=UPI0025C5C825|nr:DNA repair protein RecO [Bernardetia sp.]
MLEKTQGIVLCFTRYSETSIICRIFTKKFGLNSYVINGVRKKSKTSPKKMALYQPLTILDMVIYYKEGKGLLRISDASIEHPFKSLPFEPKKSSIALFLTEILRKALQEEGQSEELFIFLKESVIFLDDVEEEYENFHIQFLLKLIPFLGFGIESAEDFFELEMPQFEVNKMTTDYVNALMKLEYSDYLPMNGKMRRMFLYWILAFYRNHLEDFGYIRSLTVLKEIFEEE